jgi:hypothetical protein
VIFRCIAAPDAQFFGSQSIQGVLKNSQDVSGAQGYEPKKIRNFNNLQDAGGSQNPCKKRSVSIIGQLKDSHDLERKLSNLVDIGCSKTKNELSRCGLDYS